MKGIGALYGVVVLAVIAAGFLFMAVNTPVDISDDQSQLKKFSSYQEMKTYLNESAQFLYYGAYMATMDATSRPLTAPQAGPPMLIESAVAGEAATDFSTTNIQVAGVDEADIVKTDGKYVYVVAKGKIYIVDAYPAEGAEILSEMEIDGTPSEMYINDDRLVVFTSGYGGYYPVPMGGVAEEIAPRGYSGPVSKALVYDVSDPSDPVLKKNITAEGSYYDSRMIGDYVYVISQKSVHSPIEPGIPRVFAEGKVTGSGEVYYFDVPGYSYMFTSILSFNVKNQEDPRSKVFLMSYGQNLYVSMNNIYITYRKQIDQKKMMENMIEKVVLPNLPPDLSLRVSGIWNSDKPYYEKMQEITEIFQEYLQSLGPEESARLMQEIQKDTEDYYMEMSKELERSYVHRISISEGEIEYQAGGSIPGNVLNQFSMDEYEGYFRIATTVGHVSRMGEATSFNNVYVLDEDLNTVGKIEDIAPGERIYSARFIGERGYLVTFKKIDPFFVIDLSDPVNPKILGKLKIPGYSDYLHPYDENHIIGIGKDTEEAEESAGNFAWYQGVKMAIFDVTDVSDPKELHKVIIGDRGTDSYVLRDHKAFLFDREKNLLVIPILLVEMTDEQKSGDRNPWQYGNYLYQGAYVYDLTLENGFDLKGRITHYDEDDDTFMKSGYYYFGDEHAVKRSLYIDDVLYTVSGVKIKLNSLDDLSEIKELVFSNNA